MCAGSSTARYSVQWVARTLEPGIHLLQILGDYTVDPKLFMTQT